jgi:hypothetical protein
MGLETDSRQDLFVLRNVVMSPFQGTGNYSNKIAELFKGVLQEEVQVFSTVTFLPIFPNLMSMANCSGPRDCETGNDLVQYIRA